MLLRNMIYIPATAMLAACQTPTDLNNTPPAPPSNTQQASNAKSGVQCTNSTQKLIAAYDIGSGGPSLKLVCVSDTSTRTEFGIAYTYDDNDVLDVQFTADEPNFRKDLEDNKASNNGCFSNTIKDVSETWFGESVKAISSQYNAQFANIEFRGAATAAFRKANNNSAHCRLPYIDGDTLLENVVDTMVLNGAARSNIQFEVASKTVEGILEFVSVAALEELDPSNKALIWGFGSTSTQLTAWNPQTANIEFAEGLGQFEYRDDIFQFAKQKPVNSQEDCVTTNGTTYCAAKTNPVGGADALRSMIYAYDAVKRNVANVSYSFPDGPIYGVGGSLKYMQFGRPASRNSGCGKQDITLERLMLELSTAVDLERSRLCNRNRPDHATTEVTNMMLTASTLMAVGAKNDTAIKTVPDAEVMDGLLRIKDW